MHPCATARQTTKQSRHLVRTLEALWRLSLLPEADSNLDYTCQKDQLSSTRRTKDNICRQPSVMCPTLKECCFVSSVAI